MYSIVYRCARLLAHTFRFNESLIRQFLRLDFITQLDVNYINTIAFQDISKNVVELSRYLCKKIKLVLWY